MPWECRLRTATESELLSSCRAGTRVTASMPLSFPKMSLTSSDRHDSVHGPAWHA